MTKIANATSHSIDISKDMIDVTNKDSAGAKEFIAGEYGVDVRYGIMSGMDPNRAIIALLQMRSDKLVSRDYVRREIPLDLNVTQEEQRVDIEEMRDSLRVAVAQYAQAIPALASQGQDPTQIISRIAEVIQGRQKGQSLEAVIEKAFAP